MREPFVFFCEGGCQVYVIVNLNLELNGEHVMICPKCGHKHYRRVQNGQITDFRHCSGDHVDTIEPPKSAAFKTREEALAALAIGVRDPFLNDLWIRKAQEEGMWH